MNAVSWFDGLAGPGRLRDSLNTRGPQIAVWVLALALAAQAAAIIAHLAGAGRAPPAQTLVPNAPVRPHIDIAAIAASHLFGAAPVAAANNTSVPQSNIPLVLTGIIAAADPKLGLAILGPSATAAKVYAVGENVPGGARVHEVYEDHVLIDRGGRIEQLLLPHQHATGVAPPPLAAVDNPLDRARRMITENPGVIADVMRPQPVTLGGKLQGYRVFPGRNTRAFARLGLRPGDMVTGVNGTPLDDANRAQEIFNTLGSASEARITVRRNGRQQDLTLNMSQLSDAEQLVGTDLGGDAPGANPAPPAAAGTSPVASPGPVPPPVPAPTAPATGADTPNNPND